ncbi:MAG TPA: hypothetical protein PLS53_02065 [Thermoanaerobaculaceae bacterium]|nr:hypothetical protein [Thermoanaerobaculaceae bacterium]HPS76921.1 hypothetical protein [Thermoanaerobaculaceae bacterium]
MIGWLVAAMLPTSGWLVGRWLAGDRKMRPSLQTMPLVGAFAPAGLQRWCGRSAVEQAAGWVLGFVGWAAAALGRDPELLVATWLLGAIWGVVLGSYSLDAATAATVASPLQLTAAPPPVAVERPPASPDQPPLEPCPASEESDDGLAFRLALRCPTCGAELSVPVYHRMVRCEFCASEHVVMGQEEVIRAVIPDAVTSRESVQAAVLKHLRHLHYLRLYDQRVRPLVEQQQASLQQAELPLSLDLPTSPLVAAVEREVEWEADAYASRVASRLKVLDWQRFLAPYWHRFGTLYQVAFGRDAQGQKRMEFQVVTLEGSAAANPTFLPSMGKLSYLRALRPLAGSPEAAIPSLPASLGQEEIDRKAIQPAQRRSDLAITPIAQRGAFVAETVALVYRPWHLVEAEVDGTRHHLLVDGGAADVSGEPEFSTLQTAPLTTPETEKLRLTPSRCPECGGDFPFAADSVAHLCHNCFRLLQTTGEHWRAVRYAREEPRAGAWMTPFWRFPVRLRTSDGELVVDLPHLTDGIDSTYDQIGDRPQVPEFFYVPAFRVRVSKTGVRLYRRLWPILQQPRTLSRERFSAASPPGQVVAVTLPAGEAREFGRVYLALAFSPRDLARAEIKRVRAAFFDAELEGEPLLTFLNLPAELVQPFRGLLGRARLQAMQALQGRPR